jgi:hypothetical protein
VATLLTLVFLPSLYVAWFRIKPIEDLVNVQPSVRAGFGNSDRTISGVSA